MINICFQTNVISSTERQGQRLCFNRCLELARTCRSIEFPKNYSHDCFSTADTYFCSKQRSDAPCLSFVLTFANMNSGVVSHTIAIGNNLEEVGMLDSLGKIAGNSVHIAHSHHNPGAAAGKTPRMNCTYLLHSCGGFLGFGSTHLSTPGLSLLRSVAPALIRGLPLDELRSRGLCSLLSEE